MKACDLCGDIINNEVIELYMDFMQRPDIFEMIKKSQEDNEGWKHRDAEEIHNLFFDLEICQNCARLIPKILLETKKRILSMRFMEKEPERI